MAAFTNSLGDMKVVDWREFRRMEESKSSLFLARNFWHPQKIVFALYPLALFKLDAYKRRRRQDVRLNLHSS